MKTLTEIVQNEVRLQFERVMIDEINRLVIDAQAKLDMFAADQKREAKKQAQIMTLELMHKMNSAGYSVEFKI